MDNITILIVDDEPHVRFFLSEALATQGYACAEAEDGKQAIERVKEERPDIVILDLKMPRMGGMEAFAKIRVLAPDAAIIIVTAFGSRENAYEAIREGAYDFFSKPVDLAEVRAVVQRAAERARLLRNVQELRKQSGAPHTPESLLGGSDAMRSLRDLLVKIAPADCTALITGESGTGKELAAKIIHDLSGRGRGPFIIVNCAAIPANLLESEFFGHERGSFTGAHQRHIGKFEAADGGTLFLDEIGEMPLAMQTKVLRVLQERTFERVGGVASVRTDVRLIAATNQDLPTALQEGRFREDLYYRLNVVPVHILPLRERREDIPLLADHFLGKHRDALGMVRKRLSADAVELLTAYRWPGNIRELDNIVQRAVLLSPSDEITGADIAAILGSTPQRDAATDFDIEHLMDPAKSMSFTLKKAVDELTERMERRIIEQALQSQGGKRQETADLLKISRKSLHNKMKKYGIQ